MPKLESKMETDKEDLRAIIDRLENVVECLEEMARLLRSIIPRLPSPSDDDIPF